MNNNNMNLNDAKNANDVTQEQPRIIAPDDWKDFMAYSSSDLKLILSLLEIAVASPYPLNDDQLIEIVRLDSQFPVSAWSDEQVHAILNGKLSSWLALDPSTDSRQLIHQSYAVWLCDRSINNTSLLADERHGHILLAGWRLLKMWQDGWFIKSDDWPQLCNELSTLGLSPPKLQPPLSPIAPNQPESKRDVDSLLQVFEHMRKSGIAPQNWRGLTGIGVDPNAAVDGWTLLMRASWNGNLEAVKFLVSLGAGVNRAAGNGSTPVFLACQEGHVEVVRYLVNECKADVNQSRNDGRVPVNVLHPLKQQELFQIVGSFCVSLPIPPPPPGLEPQPRPSICSLL